MSNIKTSTMNDQEILEGFLASPDYLQLRFATEAELLVHLRTEERFIASEFLAQSGDWHPEDDAEKERWEIQRIAADSGDKLEDADLLSMSYAIDYHFWTVFEEDEDE